MVLDIYGSSSDFLLSEELQVRSVTEHTQAKFKNNEEDRWEEQCNDNEGEASSTWKGWLR